MKLTVRVKAFGNRWQNAAATIYTIRDYNNGRKRIRIQIELKQSPTEKLIVELRPQRSIATINAIADALESDR